jgi:site-specific DNA-methyltransferase (adenine-specific)
MLRVQYVRTSVLKTWKRNPRDNGHAVEAVAQSIRRFGFNVPILCDRKMQVISGHARLKAAKQLEMRTVPVIVLGMTKREGWFFSIIENKTADLAEWDMPQLASLIRELESLDTDLSCLGFSKAELDAPLHPEEPLNWEQTEADEQQRARQINALIPVKVRASRRQAVKNAIFKYAEKERIREKGFAITAGRVLVRLLGVRK